MNYRKLGNTGLIVSEVALGTMQFGGKMNMGNLGQEDTTRMVKLALDRGINIIDTADVYSLGESETLVGNALKGVRTEIVLATKVRLPMSDNLNRSGATRVNIMREVDASLRRLQTDYIDLYQVHGWDSNTPLEETVRTLDDVVRQGKVRYIGLSNYMSWQAATAVMLQERMGLEKFVTAQMYYSLVGRGLEYELARVLRRDCEPEMMPVLLAPFGESLRVGVVGGGVEHPGVRAVAGHSLALEVGDMLRERRGTKSGAAVAHDPGHDDDAPAGRAGGQGQRRPPSAAEGRTSGGAAASLERLASMARFLRGPHHLADEALRSLGALVAVMDAAGARIEVIVPRRHG